MGGSQAHPSGAVPLSSPSHHRGNLGCWLAEAVRWKGKPCPPQIGCSEGSMVCVILEEPPFSHSFLHSLHPMQPLTPFRWTATPMESPKGPSQGRLCVGRSGQESPQDQAGAILGMVVLGRGCSGQVLSWAGVVLGKLLISEGVATVMQVPTSTNPSTGNLVATKVSTHSCLLGSRLGWSRVTCPHAVNWVQVWPICLVFWDSGQQVVWYFGDDRRTKRQL